MVVDTIRRFFRRSSIAPDRIVAAVSGGADSTALLLGLADLRADGFEIIAAHVNHHLRGEESDGDEAFVGELCDRLGIPLHLADGTLDPESVRHRGIEAAAREVRFAKLQQIREVTNARWIATAHQRDDQAETILMRLLTGGGIGSLRGIRAIREDGIIRPLLDLTRADVDAFLRERGVTARVDRSNADSRFLRNRVRAILRELGPEAGANLAAVAEQASAQWPIIERAIDAAEDVETTVDETRFRSWPDEAWLRQALLHRHIRRLDPDARDVSAADLARLAAELDSLKRTSVTRELELVRRGGSVVLRRKPEQTQPFEVSLAVGKPATIQELGVTIHVAPASERSGDGAGRKQRIALPKHAAPEFTVRNRRRGERFHPLGLTGDKKLKDFLIDRKIPAEVRDRIPLVIWNGQIVWIPGVEVSDRFKVTPATSEVELYDVWLEDPGASVDPTDFRR